VSYALLLVYFVGIGHSIVFHGYVAYGRKLLGIEHILLSILPAIFHIWAQESRLDRKLSVHKVHLQAILGKKQISIHSSLYIASAGSILS